MNKSLIIFVSFFMIFSMPALALPDIEILSPENITYNDNKILVNVTFNETVNFFIKTGNRIIDLGFGESFETYIYAKDGSYNFTIWANNSNGTVSEGVIYSVNEGNPISITTCGIIYSYNAEYILENNISVSTGTCLKGWDLENITLNLNSKRITGYETGLVLWDSPSTEIYNGDFYVPDSPIFVQMPWGGWRLVFPVAIEITGSKYNVHDLNIHGFNGVKPYVNGALFEDIYMNSSWGFSILEMINTGVRNTIIEFSGIENPHYGYAPSAAFWDYSYFADTMFENITMKNFENDFEFWNTHSNFYLRNTPLNLSKINFEGWSETRVYNQHSIIINVTDEDGNGVPSIINVTDSGTVPRVSEEESLYKSVSNPTSSMLISTNDKGIATLWLTESLTVFRVAHSPQKIENYTFMPYQLIAQSWNTSETKQFNVSSNSTYKLNFTLSFPKPLPKCTIQQMLDLDNSGDVDINDAIIVLRYITGLPVNTTTTKECEGINLNPFS